MDFTVWAGLAVAALGLAVGFVTGWVAAARWVKLAVEQLARTHQADLAMWAEGVLAQLGNELMMRDHHRFVKFKESVGDDLVRVASSPLAEARKELMRISELYPHVTDFQIFTGRLHLLHADSATTWSTEDLETYFRDLAFWFELQPRFQPLWTRRLKLDQKDREHAQKYAQQIDDGILEYRLKQAHDEYMVAVAANEDVTWPLETVRHRIIGVPHVAEHRIGVVIKDTGEYGIVSIFYGDEETYVSYLRSDANFRDEISLLDAANVSDIRWPREASSRV
jgi:hypothetical protein